MTSFDQSKDGAEALDRVTKRMQSENFKHLVEAANIKKGWKILDMDCATGCDTATLSTMVGEQGQVVGIDPIAERIEVAKENYQNDSTTFHVAYGKDASKFGTDFDLVVSNKVMHLIPLGERQLTFQSIAQCLKPAGQFVFVVAKKETNSGSSFSKLTALMPKEIVEKWGSLVHHDTDEEMKTMALENGFSHVTIEEISLNTTLDNMEDLFEWISSACYFIDFHEMQQILEAIQHDNDLSFMFNEEGKINLKKDFLLVKCTKKN